ncbi:MAG: hypothetical protein AAF211_22730, partial [Myxococcota bacterium]
MKLVEASRLVLRGETDERAYEIDLCEVGPDRFVVNFRYGPQGSVLREGSRTPVPVSESEARRVFERLVASRRGKGYVDVDVDAGTGGVASEPATDPALPPSSRDEVLRRYLDDPTDAWTDLDGVIVRVGELRVRGCTERLVDLLVGASARRAYNVVRALLRCGDESAVPALRSVLESERPAHIRNLAAHAIVVLAAPDVRARFVAEQTELVPPRFLDALARPSVNAERLAADLGDQPRVLEKLYLVHQPAHRSGLLALLRGLSVHPPLWQAIRGIYRAAEARNDGDVFGILVHTISRGWAAGWQATGFRHATRAHFVRRSWRTLFRLATAGVHGDYAALATGVLLAVDDADASERNRRFRPGGTSLGMPFPKLWAFNSILYRNSPDHRSSHRGLTWWLGQGVPFDHVPTERVEAWPEAWNAHPERLVELLSRSRCAPVHVFAARALRALPAAWSDIELEPLTEMLGAPYPATGDLCVEIATARYTPADPDLALVAALVASPHEPARGLAQGWIRERSAPFLIEPSFLLGLVLSDWSDTRAAALEVLTGGAVTAAVASEVVHGVLGWAESEAAADEDVLAILRDASVVLQASFPAETRAVPVERITGLVTRPHEGVAELGARLLLGHATPPSELPDALLVALLTSPFESVRGVGLRLCQALDVSVLVERFRVLCDLLTHPLTDVRDGARPLVAKLVASDSAVADRLVRALLPALVIPGPDGMHDSVVALFRDELAGASGRLDRESVLRLVAASESVVQALGGDLLVHLDPST